MDRKFMHTYRVYFEVEFHGERRCRTLTGVNVVPYIFSVVDSGNICPAFIEAKNPIRAKAIAERTIKQNAQKMVYHIASKTCRGEVNTITARGPDGNYRNSKSFYSISGYKIKELVIA